MSTQTITAAELAAAPRPVRIGSQLVLLDQAHAVATMAPGGVPPLDWLARTVFATTRDGRLDRRVHRPVATLER